jgi:NTP pyrophosphatase (non-canonical NTP hydrolase)
VPEDYFASLVISARLRAEKAMRKFPQPNYVLNKVAEESGEVIKAVIHYTEAGKSGRTSGEIIDNLAMLIRLVTEGDQVIGFTPPESCRAAMQPNVTLTYGGDNHTEHNLGMVNHIGEDTERMKSNL